MKTITTSSEKARFDTRLSIEEKKLFEKAASIAGFRTLTDFVIRTVRTKAKEIIKEHEIIVASERDSELFFYTLMNPQPPNDKLQDAAKKYLMKKN
ncbi:DUF1778 domain-containing protein [Aquimarina muelleri]|uniref:type II toxin-antitoxin system TacA family antitoxin n=1 Tax=Aquimarina muelleri TaxID=279356 RepID=UPI003F6890C3